MLTKELHVRNQKFRVGIVGATGLVGSEILKVMEEREFPVAEAFLFASQKSAGVEIEFQGSELKVEELNSAAFEGKNLDFVLFATDSGLSAEYAPIAADSGAIVIDNSSHFRMDPDVPLIVPEVNAYELERAREHGIIANPNCSTIQMVVCLHALHQVAKLKRVVVSTYQSVSGAGSEALEELEAQVGGLFSGQEARSQVFPKQIAFNCIPHIDVFLENGMSKEEMKMILETRKILNLADLKITATAVRVPVFMSHSESVNVEFESPLDPQKARDLLSATEGVVVLDEPGNRLYPTPFEAAGRDEIFVGRIRRDESVEHGLHLWIVADNLRKGAATNAVQIAEACISRRISRLAA